MLLSVNTYSSLFIQRVSSIQQKLLGRWAPRVQVIVFEKPEVALSSEATYREITDVGKEMQLRNKQKTMSWQNSPLSAQVPIFWDHVGCMNHNSQSAFVLQKHHFSTSAFGCGVDQNNSLQRKTNSKEKRYQKILGIRTSSLKLPSPSNFLWI